MELRTGELDSARPADQHRRPQTSQGRRVPEGLLIFSVAKFSFNKAVLRGLLCSMI